MKSDDILAFFDHIVERQRTFNIAEVFRIKHAHKGRKASMGGSTAGEDNTADPTEGSPSGQVDNTAVPSADPRSAGNPGAIGSPRTVSREVAIPETPLPWPKPKPKKPTKNLTKASATETGITSDPAPQRAKPKPKPKAKGKNNTTTLEARAKPKPKPKPKGKNNTTTLEAGGAGAADTTPSAPQRPKPKPKGKKSTTTVGDQAAPDTGTGTPPDTGTTPDTGPVSEAPHPRPRPKPKPKGKKNTTTLSTAVPNASLPQGESNTITQDTGTVARADAGESTAGQENSITHNVIDPYLIGLAQGNSITNSNVIDHSLTGPSHAVAPSRAPVNTADNLALQEANKFLVSGKRVPKKRL